MHQAIMGFVLWSQLLPGVHILVEGLYRYVGGYCLRLLGVQLSSVELFLFDLLCSLHQLTMLIQLGIVSIV